MRIRIISGDEECTSNPDSIIPQNEDDAESRNNAIDSLVPRVTADGTEFLLRSMCAGYDFNDCLNDPACEQNIDANACVRSCTAIDTEDECMNSPDVQGLCYWRSDTDICSSFNCDNDDVKDNYDRLESIAKEVDRLCGLSLEELHDLYHDNFDIIEHNYNHLLNYATNNNMHKQIFDKVYGILYE